jgi:SNF2 family DNA or RNA helicase
MSFKGQLKWNQIEMARFRLRAKRVIDKSSTGLGKTVSSLAAAEKLKDAGYTDKCICMVKANLIEEWEDQIEQFTDSKFISIYSPSKDVHKLNEFLNSDAYYLIMSVESAATLAGRVDGQNIEYGPLFETLHAIGVKRTILILDEATKIKNYRAKKTQALKLLSAKYKWALTATPLENRPDEVFSIANWVRPNALGSWWDFDRTYIRRGMFREILGYHNLHHLHERLKPFMQGHSDKDPRIQALMPNKIVQNFFVDLSPEVSKVYDIVSDQALEDLNKLAMKSAELTELGFFDEEAQEALADGISEVDKAQAAAITKFMTLRQLCCSPELVFTGNSWFNKRMIREGVITSRLKYAKCPKLDELKRLVRIAITGHPDNKVVIFCWFTAMQDIFYRELVKIYGKDAIVKFNHNMTPRQRKEVKRRFNSDPKVRIFLSTDAGGYGINLPAGNYLINYDLPWHPGALKQRNRITRLSSKWKTNYIWNIITRNTVEERIYDINKEKQGLTQAVIEGKKLDLNKTRKESLRNFLNRNRKVHQWKDGKPFLPSTGGTMNYSQEEP